MGEVGKKAGPAAARAHNDKWRGGVAWVHEDACTRTAAAMPMGGGGMSQKTVQVWQGIWHEVRKDV